MTDEFTQDEKREILQNDRRVLAQQQNKGSTFATFAEAFSSEDRQGRYQAVNKTTVVGADPVPKYEGAPNWAHDPAGMEPPFHIDITAIEPCGQPHEVAASIAAQDVPLEPSPVPGAQGDCGDPTDAPSNTSSADVERVGPPLFSKTRK